MSLTDHGTSPNGDRIYSRLSQDGTVVVFLRAPDGRETEIRIDGEAWSALVIENGEQRTTAGIELTASMIADGQFGLYVDELPPTATCRTVVADSTVIFLP